MLNRNYKMNFHFIYELVKQCGKCITQNKNNVILVRDRKLKFVLNQFLEQLTIRKQY